MSDSQTMQIAVVLPAEIYSRHELRTADSKRAVVILPVELSAAARADLAERFIALANHLRSEPPLTGAH